MGYCMRYISADERKISLKELGTALALDDPEFEIDGDAAEGVLMYANDAYAQLEINEKGDGIFEEEIEMLREDVAAAENGERVLEMLDRARNLLFVRVLQQGRDDEETFEKIDALWNWLLPRREGLVQADLEGYYDASGLILEVE